MDARLPNIEEALGQRILEEEQQRRATGYLAKRKWEEPQMELQDQTKKISIDSDDSPLTRAIEV